MASTVHGKGKTAYFAKADVERQISAAARKRKIRRCDVEILQPGCAIKHSDGKWHIWTRIRI